MNTTILELEGQRIAAHRSAYEAIPVAFEVRSRLVARRVDGGSGGVALRETPVAAPYIKDYAAIDLELAEPSACMRAQHGKPGQWLAVLAFDGERAVGRAGQRVGGGIGERAVGGAVVALGAEAPLALDPRQDIAVLWDIRVRPDCRRRGIGGKLLSRVADWARLHGCTQLAAETQDVNVAACRFYAKHGFILGAIHPHAYAACPQSAHEAAMVWYLSL